MGNIVVIHPGVLSSVQDTGRNGYRHVGVPKSGAFDSVSLRIGNRLLDNSDSDAAIEMTMSGGEFRFTASTVVCLTGANADDAVIKIGIHQEKLHHRQPTVIPTGSMLKIGRLTNGLRGYLCIAGGIQSPQVLDSRSSLVSLPDAGLGSAIKSGDRLPFDEYQTTETDLLVSSKFEDENLIHDGSTVLRIVPGAHYELFSKLQCAALGDQRFQVSDQSNRAGVRLSKSKIPGVIPISLSSEGTLQGYVQVPPSGEPIILGVDGPTTGGYPVIACVIEADQHVLAQCEIREQFRFRWVNLEDAQEALRDQHAVIQSVKPRSPKKMSWDYKRSVRPSVLFGCDTGEALSGPGRDRELALLPYVSAVSIACGGHAGDQDSMREALSAACEHGCIIGAHPSYPDRDGFGRREIEIRREVLGSSLKEQLNTFSDIAKECNAKVSYIKAHGALYHAVSRDTSFAEWYWGICTSIFPHARFVGPLGSVTLDHFTSSGIPVFVEGFCDRVYESNGTLRVRSVAGACITDPEIAASQAERLIQDSSCQFLCVHSDTENAINIARSVHERLSFAL
ncbi:MAG: 5-oxoprolinase/urea amidolyase family protein [Phycisphaerales bacterium]|nr:5-oxoprolinase/urea amidolyase family protein [Phycisphaerales bacterium]